VLVLLEPFVPAEPAPLSVEPVPADVPVDVPELESLLEPDEPVPDGSVELEPVPEPVDVPELESLLEPDEPVLVESDEPVLEPDEPEPVVEPAPVDEPVESLLEPVDDPEPVVEPPLPELDPMISMRLTRTELPLELDALA